MAFDGNFGQFNPDFGLALQNMIAQRPGISIFSGYRTPAQQAQLFQNAIAKYGSVEAARHNVAPAPGTYGSQGSRHNFGIAADLRFASPEDRAWAHAHAAEYGLNFRMGHEPWHIELINGKATPVQGGGNQLVASVGPQDIKLPPDEVEPLKVKFPEIIPLNAKIDSNQDIYSLSNFMTPNRARAEAILNKIRRFDSSQA